VKPRPVSTGQILVVATHGIGDLVMTAKVTRLIIEAGYNVSVLVAGKVEREVGLYLLPEAECVALSSFGKNKLTRLLGVLWWMRRRKIDYALAQYGVNPPLFSLLTFWGGAKRRIGWAGRFSWLNTYTLIEEEGHKVVETAKWLDYLGIDYGEDDLYWKCADDVKSKKERRQVVIFGPSSFYLEKHKRWPPDKFAKLAQRITRKGVNVEILGSADERDYCDNIVRMSNSDNVFNRAGELSISESFSRLQAAHAVVANCNAISHMAAAVGVPVIGIYGPTDPHLTGPLCRNLVIVRTDKDCSPCYKKGYTTGCGDPACIEDISVDVVYEALCGVLEFL